MAGVTKLVTGAAEYCDGESCCEPVGKEPWTAWISWSVETSGAPAEDATFRELACEGVELGCVCAGVPNVVFHCLIVELALKAQVRATRA